MLDSKSDISGSGEVKIVAKVFRDESAAPLANKRASAWEVMARLDTTQVSLNRALHFISTMYGDYSLYEKCGHLPFIMCSPLWGSRLYSTDSRALLAHKCGRLRLSVQRSTVCHEEAGNGLLACQNVVKINITGLWYGLLAYADLE